MKPNIHSVCIVSDKTIYSSLLYKFLSEEECFFTYKCDFNNIPTDKDIYLIVTNNSYNLTKFYNIDGYKVLLTDNNSINCVKCALENGITTIYDSSIDMNELRLLGLHLYIYQKGLCNCDLGPILRMLFKGKIRFTKNSKLITGLDLEYHL